MDLNKTQFKPLSFDQLPVYDGLILPGFPPLMADINRHMTYIKELETRESDILISAYPKSGTHWVTEIVEQLTAGKAEYSAKPKGGAFLEAVDIEKIGFKDQPSPRNFNTHLPIRMLPRKHIELKAKIIHVMRNPKDVAVSFYNHVLKDPFLGCTTCSWEEFLQRYITKVAYGTWFEYEKDWIKAKKENPDLNLLDVHYENLKLNTEEEITKIADFLGINYTEDLIRGISEKVDFKNVQKGKVDITATFSVDKKGFVYRKGEIGDWKNWFTVAQNEMFDQLYEKEMKDVDLKFRFSK